MHQLILVPLAQLCVDLELLEIALSVQELLGLMLDLQVAQIVLLIVILVRMEIPATLVLQAISKIKIANVVSVQQVVMLQLVPIPVVNVLPKNILKQELQVVQIVSLDVMNVLMEIHAMFAQQDIIKILMESVLSVKKENILLQVQLLVMLVVKNNGQMKDLILVMVFF